MLRHFWQADRVTCLSNAYRTILSGFGILISEKQACDECKTTKNGTSVFDGLSALKKRGLDAHYVSINQPFALYGRWLNLNSNNRFLLVNCYGQNKGKRGRPTEEHHAICLYNGKVWDSACKEILPLDVWASIKYNKQFIVNGFVMIESPLKKTKDSEENI